MMHARCARTLNLKNISLDLTPASSVIDCRRQTFLNARWA